MHFFITPAKNFSIQSPNEIEPKFLIWSHWKGFAFFLQTLTEKRTEKLKFWQDGQVSRKTTILNAFYGKFGNTSD